MTALPCHGAQVVVTCGGVAEWSNAAVSKTVIGASLSEVRILSPPPVTKTGLLWPVLVTGWRLRDENRRGRFDKISGRNFGRRRTVTLTEPPLDGAKPGGERQSSPRHFTASEFQTGAFPHIFEARKHAIICIVIWHDIDI